MSASSTGGFFGLLKVILLGVKLFPWPLQLNKTLITSAENSTQVFHLSCPV